MKFGKDGQSIDCMLYVVRRVLRLWSKLEVKLSRWHIPLMPLFVSENSVSTSEQITKAENVVKVTMECAIYMIDLNQTIFAIFLVEAK